jgi:putative NADH-flavin reductase
MLRVRQEDAMKLIVFGSAGRTGSELVGQALEQGHEVTAFTRNAEAVTRSHAHLRVAEGNVLDAAAVEAAVPGHDAALAALGVFALRKNTELSDGTRNVIGSLKRHHVRRLIVVSSLGVGDCKDQLGVFYNVFLIPVILNNVFADKETQELYVRESDLDWTIVRPGALTDGPRTGQYRTGVGTSGVPPRPKISRADVAEFMLRQLTDTAHLQRTVEVFY